MTMIMLSLWLSVFGVQMTIRKNFCLVIFILFGFLGSVHSFDSVKSFFVRQCIGLEKKAISLALSRYLYFSPSMTSSIMAIQGLGGFLVGVTSDDQTSQLSHMRKLFNAVAASKIAEHIVFNDTGFKGFGSGHYYHHVMTLLSIAFGYSIGYSTRLLYQDIIKSKEVTQ